MERIAEETRLISALISIFETFKVLRGIVACMIYCRILYRRLEFTRKTKISTKQASVIFVIYPKPTADFKRASVILVRMFPLFSQIDQIREMCFFIVKRDIKQRRSIRDVAQSIQDVALSIRDVEQ